MPSKRTICFAILLVLLAFVFSSCRKNVNPKEAMNYIAKGIAKHQLKDFQGAIKDYNMAIEMNPQSVEAYFFRGFAKQELADKLGAIQDYTQAIKLNPQYAVAYLHRGITNLALGVQEAGCMDLREADALGEDRAKDILNKFCK